MRSAPAPALALLASLSCALAQPDGQIHPLLPGITAEPLPLDLPNCNNLLYRHDGKLVALGYAGDVYLLSDTDGDGREDKVELFWESKGRLVGQVGMDLAPKGSPHGNAVFLAAKGKIVMLADRDGDDRAEVMETLAEGWPPARAGVDVTGLTLDPRDGAVWFGLGVRLYNDAYEIEETGRAQNDLGSERGAIHRIAPDFKSREKICTGIRWPIALRFNEHGDLFCTDQEGATWLPNGNPFDELLHIEAGRHYGFPPRHPTHLPNVIDEPSVYDYGPQHQSTCGMNFNQPVNGGPVFGPAWWKGDALVAGESRGKIFRTKLVKTDSGYVAHNEIVACLGMMIIDQCLSPSGELRVCTHSGDPDWGTGPTGRGMIWRIRYDDRAAQPVLAWRESPDEIRVAFDRPAPPDWVFDGATVEASPNARAGDRFETMRPPYEVVKRQQAEGRRTVPVLTATNAGHLVTLRTAALPEATWLSIDLPGGYSLQTDTSGVLAEWMPAVGERSWTRRLPHLDLKVARSLTAPSPHFAPLGEADPAGALTLRTQLDLWQMLHPAVQKDAHLDYEYAPERVTVTFSSSTSPFTLKFDGETRASTPGHVTHDLAITVTPEENRWFPIELTMRHPGGRVPELTAFWSTSDDRRHRAFPTRRFVMPWAQPAAPRGQQLANRPEIAGGDWARGKALFFGTKALCSSCHQRDGEGLHLGPDLSTLPHRSYASVLHDLREPSASINPDYPTQEIELASGTKLVAVPLEQPDGSVRLGIGPGAALAVKKSEIVSAKPVANSLMPAGLDQALDPAELRDLMTFLLTPAPVMGDYPSLPRDGVEHAPPLRTRAEIAAVLAGAPTPPAATKPIAITLVAGPKDHGFGEHDYPRWQQVWSRLLSLASDTEVSTAWEWPSPVQWESSDVLVFFKRGNWSAERSQQLHEFLAAGGGAVFIHWACEADEQAPALAEVIGLASNSKLTKYRHGVIDLTFPSQSPHPITRGFATARFHDESYWELVGDPANVNSLATAPEAGRDHPLFWTVPSGKGRVFVSIPGHYSWTFDDPLFRILLLRGIAWTAGEPVDRFNNLIEAGLDVEAGRGG